MPRTTKLQLFHEWLEDGVITRKDILEIINKCLEDDYVAENEVLACIDTDAIESYLYHEGKYNVMVRVDNMVLKDKLETFLKTEIFPYYNDHKSILI